MARTRTSWQQGQSGNPQGRPKVVGEIRDAAREHGPACIMKLVQMAGLNGTRGANNEAVRLGAVRELLDRGFGKATQHIAGDEQAAPMAFDFRWADATPQSASDAPAENTAKDLVHRTVAGAPEEDAGAVADMITCGTA